MTATLNIIGQRFTRLTVTAKSPLVSKAGKSMWICDCDCGKTVTIVGSNLKSSMSKSCGCLRDDKLLDRVTTNGLRYTPEYGVWLNMKDRCNNSNALDYHYYGGRGIKLCVEWEHDFTAFYKDMGERPVKGYQIDRRDSNLGYCKDNCRWIPKLINDRNKRNCKFWYVDGIRYDSLLHASQSLNKGITTVKGWCEGKSSIHKGKLYEYPPRVNCWSEAKYAN